MRLWWTAEWDMMIGCDFHMEITATPPPVEVPMVPHGVTAAMHWALNGGEFAGKTVIIENQLHCHHMQDIKFVIPHIPIPIWPPCVLALVHTACSKSKIVLGAFTVRADDKVAGLPPSQLHCNDPCHLPTGLQIPTRLPTVWCGFSWLDVLASLIVAAIDVLISKLIDLLVHRIPFLGTGATGPHGALAKYWIDTEAEELFKLALPELAKIAGREFLKRAAEKGGEEAADHTGWVEHIDEFFSDTIAEWNPRATPERIAAAADRSIPYFADRIYDKVMGDQGSLPALQTATGELIGDSQAAKAIEEVRTAMSRESWRQLFAQGFGQDFRDTMARYFEDRCEKMNAEETGLSGPRQA